MCPGGRLAPRPERAPLRRDAGQEPVRMSEVIMARLSSARGGMGLMKDAPGPRFAAADNRGEARPVTRFSQPAVSGATPSPLNRLRARQMAARTSGGAPLRRAGRRAGSSTDRARAAQNQASAGPGAVRMSFAAPAIPEGQPGPGQTSPVWIAFIIEKRFESGFGDLPSQ
jgi:hypothetical protein